MGEELLRRSTDGYRGVDNSRTRVSMQRLGTLPAIVMYRPSRCRYTGKAEHWPHRNPTVLTGINANSWELSSTAVSRKRLILGSFGRHRAELRDPERSPGGRRFKSCQPDSVNPFRPGSEGVYCFRDTPWHSNRASQNLTLSGSFPAPRPRARRGCRGRFRARRCSGSWRLRGCCPVVGRRVRDHRSRDRPLLPRPCGRCVG